MDIGLAIVSILGVVAAVLGARFAFWPWRATRATRLALESHVDSTISAPTNLQLPDASARKEAYLWALLHQGGQPLFLGCALYLFVVAGLFNFLRFPPDSFLRLIGDAIVAMILWVPVLIWVDARKEKVHQRVLAVLKTSDAEEAKAVLRRLHKAMEEQSTKRARKDAELAIAGREAGFLFADCEALYLPFGYNTEGLRRQLQWPNRCAGCGDVLSTPFGYVQVTCSDYLGGGMSTHYNVKLPLCSRFRCRIGKGEIIDANGNLLFKEGGDAFRPTGTKDHINGVHKAYVGAFRELNKG